MSSGRVVERRRHSFLVESVIRLVKEKPLGTVGAVITMILLFAGIFANFLAPYGMNEPNGDALLAAPSARFWMGTDNLGRDIFSRVIFGARVSVIVGLAATSLCVAINLIIGVLCGYIGGNFDLIVQRVVDAVMCLPSLILLMVLMSLVGSGMMPLIILIGITWGISGSRLIRSTVISIKENVYITAAVAIGCPTRRILTRHILPNIMAPTIVLFTTLVPGIIMTEASLSFLGFGVPPPNPSWGGMLSGNARSYMFDAPWMAIWPGFALAVAVYGINMFGDALRDILDPRLRGGAGRYKMKLKRSHKGESIS